MSKYEILRVEVEVQLNKAQRQASLTQVGLCQTALDALAALRELKRGGKCWCDMAIGNPMVREHSKGCKMSQAILDE